MDIELVTIGTELLLGFTIDTNAAELARALATVGARVVRRTTVGDEAAARELRQARQLGERHARAIRHHVLVAERERLGRHVEQR